MQVEKLRQVYMVSKNIEKDSKFYTEVLGLKKEFSDDLRWVQLRAGAVSLALADASEGLGAAPGVPVPVFEVGDLDAALSEVRAHGRQVGVVRDMGAHGRTAAITDPSGVMLVLFQR